MKTHIICAAVLALCLFAARTSHAQSATTTFEIKDGMENAVLKGIMEKNVRKLISSFKGRC